MKITTLALPLAAVVYACTTTPATDDVPSDRSPTPEIVKGNPINSKGDPLASVFPFATVRLVNDPPPGSKSDPTICTGVLLGPQTVLTAAHCLPNIATDIQVYGKSAATPLLPQPNLGTIHYVDFPLGVTGLTPLDKQCTGTSLLDANGIWADLALITLDPPSPAPAYPFIPVVAGISGSYASEVLLTKWGVGVGAHNGIANSSGKMAWVPITMASIDDTPGWIEATKSMTNPGDDGGPLFQDGAPLGSASGALVAGDGGPPALKVIGILSGTCPNANGVFVSRYTSLQLPATWSWIDTTARTRLASLPPPPPPPPPPPNPLPPGFIRHFPVDGNYLLPADHAPGFEAPRAQE